MIIREKKFVKGRDKRKELIKDINPNISSSFLMR